MSFINKWVETLMRFDPVKMSSDDDKLHLFDIQISQSTKTRLRLQPGYERTTHDYLHRQIHPFTKCERLEKVSAESSEGLPQRLQIRPSPGEILAEMRKSKFVKGWAFQLEFAGALSNMFDVLMPAPHRTIPRTTNEPQKKASRKANQKGGIL